MRKRFWRAVDWFIGPRVVHNKKLRDYMREHSNVAPKEKDLLGRDAEGHSWPQNEEYKPYPH